MPFNQNTYWTPPSRHRNFVELKRPWKLCTLGIGLALLIWGSYYYEAPDWDIPISVIMALFSYLTASWSMHVLVERRWQDFPLMLFFTWWTVDGCYALYWYFNDPVALEMMRSANAPASLSLYWMCGLVWYWNGTLGQLFARLKAQLSRAPTFRRAEAGDVAEIVELVNAAYRGDSSRVGWTTEADLLGGQRTDADEIAALIAQPDSVFLLCQRDEGIVGSAHLARAENSTARLGMLVIRPGLQGQGLGRDLMDEAERFVRAQWGAVRIEMQVISLREELLAYYRRRGYQPTGEQRPFPIDDSRFGLPKVQGLVFEVLEKTLAS